MVEPSDASGARRLAILDAATGVFSRYGFKKTSMDDLARAAGLSRQGLYLHFPTKEALFKAAILHIIATLRTAGRAALAHEELGIEERLLAMFEAVHGHLIGLPGSEHMNELLDVATELVGPVVEELETSIVADVARVLRGSAVATAWKGVGISVKELAENLHATSYGVKHRVKTQAEYRDRMRVALQITCAGPGSRTAADR